MNENINILIVDDNQDHIDIIIEKLDALQLNYYNYVTTYESAILSINKDEPDLILLDYFLDKNHTCLDVITSCLLQKDIPTIILTSFYEEKLYNEVAKIYQADFISKDASLFEFRKSIHLALSKRKNDLNRALKSSFLFIKLGKNIKKVNIQDIEMIEVDGKYLNIYTSEHTYVVRSTLNDFHKRLNNDFVKTHQSFIVNINFIETIHLELQKIKLKNHEALFSRSFKKELLKVYTN